MEVQELAESQKSSLEFDTRAYPFCFPSYKSSFFEMVCIYVSFLSSAAVDYGICNEQKLKIEVVSYTALEFVLLGKIWLNRIQCKTGMKGKR